MTERLIPVALIMGMDVKWPQ